MGSREHLTTMNGVVPNTTQEATHVLPGNALVKLSMELLDADADGRERVAQAHNFHPVPRSHTTLLNPSGHDGSTPFDGVDSLNRHQKRLLDVPKRRRNVMVQGGHEFLDATAVVPRVIQRSLGVATNARKVLSIEAVLREQVTHFELHELDKFLVVHEVAFVEALYAS